MTAAHYTLSMIFLILSRIDISASDLVTDLIIDKISNHLLYC